MNSRELIKLAAARIAMQKIAVIESLYGPQDMSGVGYNEPPQPNMADFNNYAASVGSMPSGIIDTPASVIQAATPGAAGAQTNASGAVGGDPITQFVMSNLPGLFSNNLGTAIKNPLMLGVAPLLMGILGGQFRGLMGNIVNGPNYTRQINQSSRNIERMADAMRSRQSLGWERSDA